MCDACQSDDASDIHQADRPRFALARLSKARFSLRFDFRPWVVHVSVGLNVFAGSLKSNWVAHVEVGQNTRKNRSWDSYILRDSGNQCT